MVVFVTLWLKIGEYFQNVSANMFEDWKSQRIRKILADDKFYRLYSSFLYFIRTLVNIIESFEKLYLSKVARLWKILIFQGTAYNFSVPSCFCSPPSSHAWKNINTKKVNQNTRAFLSSARNPNPNTSPAAIHSVTRNKSQNKNCTRKYHRLSLVVHNDSIL